MHALYLIVPVLCVLAIAYRYYSAFIAARLMVLDDSRVTPGHQKYDGANYYPTSRWVLFGHHFAAIAGSGPLVGPVLAAQFGYAPGLIWLVGGVCLAGAVQDFICLWASTRRGGRSLADIARTEAGTIPGITAAIAVLFILIIALAGLGIVVVNTLAASVLPGWRLLTRRGYLSTFMKIGTITFLVVGVMIINPRLEAPAFSQFVGGGGPIIPGALFPFVFIAIACGAISGFHALVSTGTTSKMVDNETDIRPIGYGAMLIECVVGVVAMITASVLHPGDYYAINTPPEVFRTLGLSVVNLPDLQTQIGEVVAG